MQTSRVMEKTNTVAHEFICDEGFTIEGTTSVTCIGSEDGGVEGAWNGTTPICEDILCPPLEPPANGDISCTEENVFGSTCYFVCAPGYQLSGSSLLTCTGDGSSTKGDWDNEEPTCNCKCLSKYSSVFRVPIFCDIP